jgi:hypothetical protein
MGNPAVTWDENLRRHSGREAAISIGIPSICAGRIIRQMLQPLPALSYSPLRLRVLKLGLANC